MREDLGGYGVPQDLDAYTAAARMQMHAELAAAPDRDALKGAVLAVNAIVLSCTTNAESAIELLDAALELRRAPCAHDSRLAVLALQVERDAWAKKRREEFL